MASLGDLIVTVGAKIDGFERAMGTVSQRLTAIDNQANRMTRGFEKIGESATQAGMVLSAAFTAPIAGVGALTTKLAADFELSMRKVTSIIDNVTEKDFRKLNDQVLNLSKTMGVDAVQASAALYQAISSGIPKENAVDFLQIASKAAIAGLTDTRTAVNGLTTMMLAFGLQASETTKVADAMFQAVKIGKMEFPDLSASIGEAAGMAHALGISYQELLAATATLTLTTGSSASEAVTKLTSAMKAIISPTKEMSELLTLAGFRSGETMLKTLGLEGSIKKLNDAAQGSVTVLEAAFGRVEGLRGILGLAGTNAELAAQHLTQLKQASDGLGQTTLTLNEINKSTNRQFELLVANLKASAISIGTALLPTVNNLLAAMQPLVKWLEDASKWFASLDQSTRTWIVAVGAAVAAVGPLLLVFGTMTAATASAISGFASMGGALLLASGVFTGFIANVQAVGYALVNGLLPALTAAERSSLAGVIVTTGQALTTFAVSTIPQAIIALSNLSRTLLVDAWATISVSITTAATAMRIFTMETIPAAIGNLVAFRTSVIAASVSTTEFATVSLASAATSLRVFALETLPAAAVSLAAFARTAVTGASSAFLGLSFTVSNAITAITSTVSSLLSIVVPILGVFALNIAAAFGGFKLGEWLSTHVELIGRFGQAIADAALKIPLLSSAIKYLVDGFKSQEEAEKQLEETNVRLAARLAAQGIVVDKGSMSAIEYSAALREAAKNAKVADDSIAALNKSSQASAESAKKAADGFLLISQQLEKLQATAKTAETTYKFLLTSYYSGNATIDQVIEAYKRMDAAQVEADGSIALAREQRQKYYGLLRDEAGNIIPTLADAIGELEHQYDAVNVKAKTFYEKNPIFAEQVKIVASMHTSLAQEIAKTKVAMDLAGTSLDTFDKHLTEGLLKLEDFNSGIKETTDKHLPDFAVGVYDIIPQIKELSDAFRYFHLNQSQSLENSLEKQKIILESGVATERQKLIIRREILKQQIEAQEAAGEAVTLAQSRELKKLEDQLNAHRERVFGTWQNFVAGLTRIFEGMGAILARNIFSALSNKHNEELDRQEQDLRSSLESRGEEYEKYVSDTALKLDRLREANAADLAKQEQDLLNSLDKQRADYDGYVASVGQKIEDIRIKHAEAIEAETAKQMDGLRKQEESFQEYQQRQIESLEEFKRRTADKLAEDLSNLRSSLRDRAASYEEYAQDAVASIEKVRRKNAEQAADQIGNVKQSLADKEVDYKRFVEDTQERIAKLRAKNGATVTEEEKDLQKSLRRRTEDMETYRQRASEKISEITRKHAQETKDQEDAINLSLKRRTEEWEKYKRTTAEKMDELTRKAGATVEAEERKVNESIEARAAALVAYRQTVKANLDQAIEEHRVAQAKEERDLRDSLAARGWEWDAYQNAAAEKLENLRTAAAEKLKAGEDDLANSLSKQTAEWDRYKVNTLSKIAELEREHNSLIGRIGDAWVDAFKRAGETIVTFGTEFLFGKLFKWMRETFLDDILDKIGKKIIGIFADFGSGIGKVTSSVPSLPGPSIPTGGGIPSVPGGGAGGGGAPGGATSGLAGTINVISGAVSAISSVIGNFQMAGMNKSLDLIVLHTLRTANQLIEGIQPNVNEYLPKLKDIHDFNWNFLAPQVAYIESLLEGSSPHLAQSINTNIAPQLDNLLTAVGSIDLKIDTLNDIRSNLDVANYYLEAIAAEPIAKLYGESETTNVAAQPSLIRLSESLDSYRKEWESVSKQELAILSGIQASVLPLDNSIKGLITKTATNQTSTLTAPVMPDWFRLGIPSNPAPATNQRPVHVQITLDGRTVGDAVISAAQLQGTTL